MSTAMEDQMHAALEELREQQARIARTRQQMAGAHTKVSSKDHMVTVTLDGSGELTDIAFNTQRFRKMAPAELGAEIVATIKSARTAAAERMVKAYQPLLPAGLDLSRMMRGDVDLDAMFDEAVRVAGQPLPGEARADG